MRRARRIRGAAGSPRLRLGLRGLGQASTLTPDQAFQQAIQQSGFGPRNPRDFQNQTWLNKIYSQIQNGQFDTTWVSPSCAGIIQTNPDLSLTQAAGSIAGATVGAFAGAAGGTPAAIVAGTASAAGVALGAATLGIGLVVTILSFIFAHHAQAVAQEQNLECTGTGAANNAMNVIAEGVQSGQISPATAVQSLNSLYSQYSAIVKPSFGTSPWCNANCELQIVMLAMVLYWQAQYQAMADAAAAGPITSSVASTVRSAAASAGLPSWIVWALGGLLLYEVVT